ncbi:hypothetical protein HHI36_000058 [Cryptolaemus montrouzieri]|uniref:Uncharacterized protein n=1 Tax=Cryptolaemus montrouzieri TaxID=559131 RepID=A0ABD2P4E3_9CUCU
MDLPDEDRDPNFIPPSKDVQQDLSDPHSDDKHEERSEVDGNEAQENDSGSDFEERPQPPKKSRARVQQPSPALRLNQVGHLVSVPWM